MRVIQFVFDVAKRLLEYSKSLYFMSSLSTYILTRTSENTEINITYKEVVLCLKSRYIFLVGGGRVSQLMLYLLFHSVPMKDILNL